MESRSLAELVVAAPGSAPRSVPLTGARITVGRLPGENDIALQPDPQQLVTRSAHLVLEREGAEWFLVDGGGVNGTFLRRAGEPQRVTARTLLHDGDVVCVLAAVGETGEQLRRKLEPFDAEHLIENERGLGYRMRTCRG